MSEPVIDIRDVRRIYRVGGQEVRALDGVSLIVEGGEFVAIMGASGSGKSTLMYILGCLDRPTSGQYLFEGVDVARLDEPALARIRGERIGFVFQSFNLLARTSALENVALPLFYAAAGAGGRAPRQARAREGLGALGLADRERNTPGQLSGGQQQRVAIARALINRPAVLLADEPTGNLDSRTSHEIMETLKALNRDHGLTVVVVTHERDIAAYADRTITMRDGRILSDERTAPPPRAAPREPIAAGAPVTSAWTSASAFAQMVVGAAMQALGRNKMRSALTMLGVFIGVAALIAMVAVGEGANEAVKRQIASLGTNLMVVVPGARTTGGARGGYGSASSLTVADAEAIRREAPDVAKVAYVIRSGGQVEYRGKNWQTSLMGVTPSYWPITNWRIADGRGITDEDVAASALVAVIGETVARELFSAYESPVGATILIKGNPMRVIGVYAPKGQTSWGQDQDDLIMVPFTTGERKILGVAAPTQPPAAQATTQTSTQTTTQVAAATTQYPPPPNPIGVTPRLTGFVNQIYAQATTPETVNPAIRQVTDILMRRHRIANPDDADFRVRNLSQIAEAAEGSSRIMALLLATVASISLLVGGIGIMNILLVSVTERTREIGLRMAIGARRLHVLLQFLAESVFLSVTGGIAGILAGVAVSYAVSGAADWPILLSPMAIVGGFVFSVAVGVFFGYYPAWKAARLDPIDALRHE
jgi:macrolide transport system ATP-binding/permease protein